MKANISTFFFAKISVLVLLFLSIILLCYFSWGLYSSIKFRELIDRASPLYSLLKDISKERSARLIKEFYLDVDIDIGELEEATNNLAKELNMPDYFFHKLNSMRENFDVNVTNREFLLGFSELDEYILAEFDRLHLKNVNSEINSIIMAMWQIAKDDVRQNNIKDLLVKAAWAGKVLSKDDLLLLDDLYFEYANYIDILYQTPASFATFNKIDFDEIKAKYSQDKEYTKYNIEKFYNIVHSAIIRGEITTNPNVIMDVSRKIENKNGENIDFLIDFTKKTQLNSIYIITFYTCVSFFIVLLCAYTFISLKRREKCFLENLSLLDLHTQNLKAIARFRSKNPDDAEIYKLFGDISEHFYEMDKIELRNKNEYSFFMDLITSEVKNPLNDIVGNIQLLQMLKSNTQQHETYYNKLLGSAKELDVLFNSLLKISSIQAKNLSLELLEVDIFDAINNVISDVIASIKQNNKTRINFIAYIDPELEGGVVCDIAKLRFVFATLLGNAIKYCSVNGMIALVIKCEHTEIQGEKIIKRIRISIIDNGSGFDQTTLIEHSQTDKNIKVYSTKGLNLTISREYLRVMGSKLEINSSQKGTKASFILEAEFCNHAHNLKGAYAGKKIYVYESSLPKFELPMGENNETLKPRVLLDSYLRYLGFDYEFTDAKLDDAIYIVVGEKEPFDMQKCIFCSPTPPDVITDDKVHIETPFCVNSIANAYDIITGKARGEQNIEKLEATALVLTTTAISSLVAKYIQHVKLPSSEIKDYDDSKKDKVFTLEGKLSGKYDIVFVDTDMFKNLKVDCPVVSISNKELKKGDINSPILRSIICDKNKTERLEQEIIYSINVFKRRKGLITGGIKDILLFKKSLAASNIYKSAMLSFASSVDVVNDIGQFYKKLKTDTYKVVMCDCGIKGFTYEAYKNAIEEARKSKGYQTVAVLFKGSNDTVHVKDFFEIISTKAGKRDLEQSLKRHLNTSQY